MSTVVGFDVSDMGSNAGRGNNVQALDLGIFRRIMAYPGGRARLTLV